MNRILLVLSLCAPLLWGCKPDHTQTLRDVRAAIEEPIATEDVRHRHEALVQRAVEDGAFERLTRPELQQQLGQGTRCAVDPICAQQGFEQEDMYFEIGTRGEGGRPPIVLVGFDTEGVSVRSRYLTFQ